MRRELTLPELGAGDMTVTASVWLAEAGERVSAGDRILEVSFGCVTVDLPAPVDGVLAELLVQEDDELFAGQILGVVVVDD